MMRIGHKYDGVIYQDVSKRNAPMYLYDLDIVEHDIQ